MGDVLRAKVLHLIQIFEKKHGKIDFPHVMPPPASADAAAASTVSINNAQIMAGVVLGLHGPPKDGVDAAKKLMAHFVDWNEVRVSRPSALAAVLGRQTNAAARVALLQRFLEAFFLSQRSLNLDWLYTLKSHEAKRYLSELEVFDREELAAVYLTGFKIALFPPSEVLRDLSEQLGLLKPKTTPLQMAKRFEDVLNEELLYGLYTVLYNLQRDPDLQAELAKKAKKK